MCGIVGYLGKKEAKDILIEGLKRLEYRGYDSSGIAINHAGKITCIKAVGKIASLEKKIGRQKILGNAGIAHTRWATHGEPNEKNAHPHSSGKVQIVHNGIIENYQTLKGMLEAQGFVFASDTDTEVIAHLIADLYSGDLKDAFIKACGMLKGAFAVAAIHEDEPGRLMVMRFGSPLVIGLGNEETLVASDVSALILHTRNVIFMNDGEIADISAGEIKLFTADLGEVKQNVTEVQWEVEQAGKGGYPHYMLKEIMEQPDSIANTLRGRLLIEEGNVRLGGIDKFIDRIREIRKVRFVVCGTARHAALTGQYLFEEFADISAEVDYASEFRYRKTVWDRETAVIAVSQSGETADTLAAVREAKQKGALTLSIINTVGSTIARESDAGVYNHIGPEISVASTKAFTSQLAVLVMLAVRFARLRGMSMSEGRAMLEELSSIPEKMREILKLNDSIRDLAAKYLDYKHFGFLGRKYGYPMALEGALKLKEISYIHAEGFPSGELKHGSIALIDKDFPSFFIVPKDSVYEKNLSNIAEIKSRKGRIIAVTNPGCSEVYKLADDVIEIPATSEALSPLLTALPAQLFAYHAAALKGFDVDKPRNLAKSVTVE